jgi:hypothetical protein
MKALRLLSLIHLKTIIADYFLAWHKLSLAFCSAAPGEAQGASAYGELLAQNVA